jgi:hypothetical protein
MSDLVRVKGTTATFTTTQELADERGWTTLKGAPTVYETGPRAGLPIDPKPLESITEKVDKASTSKTSKES